MKISPRLVAALVVVALGACSSDPDRPTPTANPFGKDETPHSKERKADRDSRYSAEQLYRSGRASLDAADFQGAIEMYDKVTLRFPFSDFATQSELERIYAEYRSFDPDKALSSADKFLREHPRHPAVDYVQYIKGMVNFSRDESALNILPIDDTKSDVTSQRRAFDDFQVLLQKYPSSRYAGDAWQRMVYIRNRLAEHELHVVDFYVRRGAYMAAAKRAEQIISLYPGTAASYSALEALADCYERAGLPSQAADARKLIAAQDIPKAIPAEPGKRAWYERVGAWFSPSKPSEELPADTSAVPPPPPAPDQPQSATAPPASSGDLNFYSAPDSGAAAPAAPVPPVTAQPPPASPSVPPPAQPAAAPAEQKTQPTQPPP